VSTFLLEAQMSTADVAAIARHLYETRGAKAIAEAARNSDAFRKAGDAEQAKHWQRVENALRDLRGARQS